MLNTLESINKDYLNQVILLDNNSQRKETIAFLNNVSTRVVFNKTNMGPWVSQYDNAHLYNELPEKFILTDPDLQLNPNTPPDFIEQLVKLSEQYPEASKIGLALDLSDHHLFFDGIYSGGKSIYEHESQFWTTPIVNSQYELYRAHVDTTFCIINKTVAHRWESHIRVAGVFTCKHVPWYKTNPVLSVYENYTRAKSNTNISTISPLITSSIERDYLCIKKNEQTVLIQKNSIDKNLGFWRDTFSTWEPYTFHIFDRFLDPTKTCIDIGGWIGTTCIYASRKSKNVIVIEADPLSYTDLERNCRLNDCNNVSLIHKAVFNETGRRITIVGNNESTSQITLDGSGHPIDTISLNTLLVETKTDPSTISLIKVDIEGAEEFILHDLYEMHKTYNIPLYVSFHYSFFKDKNLDRFEFLTEHQKNIIRFNPFPSFLFYSDSQVDYLMS